MKLSEETKRQIEVAEEEIAAIVSSLVDAYLTAEQVKEYKAEIKKIRRNIKEALKG